MKVRTLCDYTCTTHAGVKPPGTILDLLDTIALEGIAAKQLERVEGDEALQHTLQQRGMIEAEPEQKSEVEAPAAPVKRGRGRPRKNVSVSDTA